mmetsp:Transcript_71251/g.204405  ORF Transcript_71251/g.204405 Transcript_71251/m.204405 type:complete len:493 (-) Transcript_71251:46-1524(-)
MAGMPRTSASMAQYIASAALAHPALAVQAAQAAAVGQHPAVAMAQAAQAAQAAATGAKFAALSESPHFAADQHNDAEGETCEYANVMSSMLAAILSIVAALMAILNQADVQACLTGLGGGAGPLQGLMNSLTINYCVIVTLNITSTAAIWLSFFHCDFLEYHWKNVITSARSLCWLLGLTYTTFCFQLLRVGYALTMHGVLACLAYICNLGPGVVYLAQELVYAMGNATATSGASGVYSPYGDRAYGSHSASSMYFSMDDLVTKFDILTYCKDTDEGRDAGASAVMLGCFFTLISQSLMVAALSGEKARVSVHDLHEQHGLGDMMKQFRGEGLSAYQQGLSAYHQLPALTAQGQHPSGFSSSMLSGWGGQQPSMAGYTAGSLGPGSPTFASSRDIVANSARQAAAYPAVQAAQTAVAAAAANPVAAASALADGASQAAGGFNSAFGAGASAAGMTGPLGHISHGARKIGTDAASAAGTSFSLGPGQPGASNV